jgi:hypothetical protein
MIDFHHICTFPHKAKKTQVAVTHEINPVLSPDTIKYSTGKWIRRFIYAEGEEDFVVDPKAESDFGVEERIATLLHSEPFLSLRQIAKKVMSSKSTVHRDSTSSSHPN